MGGYGAVVYGALLGVDVIVATGAVLRLFEPGSRSLGFVKNFGRAGKLRPPDLCETVANARGRFFLYLGEHCYPDLASARMIMELSNVFVTTLENFSHWLVNYIEWRYGLLRFVMFHLEQERVFPFEDGETGDLAGWCEHWDLLHQGALGWLEPQRGLLVEQIRQSTDSRWEMHCRLALCQGATRSGFHQRAVKQAEKALHACPESGDAARRLVRALRPAGAPPSEWLKVAAEIRDLNRPQVFESARSLLRAMAHSASRRRPLE